MDLRGKKILDDYLKGHADVRSWIENWVSDVGSKETKWTRPQDIKDRYNTVSFLDNCIVIFNVKGNSYRLETKVTFPLQIVLVVWIGTHSEYDKRNKAR